jgi:hypothetical protein
VTVPSAEDRRRARQRADEIIANARIAGRRAARATRGRQQRIEQRRAEDRWTAPGDRPTYDRGRR